MRRLPSSSSRVVRGSSVALLVLSAAVACAAAANLAQEPSAFLQAQSGSPVNWAPWGAEAFARARSEKKPVYLAMGAFASELSRAMSRQSFSNPETGAFLNEHFVCVLVDAKEQPDVAALYQNYLQAVKQVSGPPMNVWLTPDLKPFEGSNYLPPTEEWGREGFVTVAKRVAAAWSSDPSAQAHKADEGVATVVAAQHHAAPAAADAAAVTQLLNEAKETWKARFDAANGGFGEPPKYLEPELLRFLLRDPATQPMAVTTLRGILHSPVHDPLDGGFFRSGSDVAWRQPYFQKSLADQARIALALLDAAKATGDREFADGARAALDYVLSRLAGPGGDRVATEDATGEELVATFLWTPDELKQVLGEKGAADFAAAYGVTAAGNVAEDAFPGISAKGKSLLQRSTPPGDATAEKALAASAAKLLRARDQRPAARHEDGATAGAHGLLLTALARAGAELADARLGSAAKMEAAFIREHLVRGDALRRLSGRPGEAAPADYALVAEGLRTHAAVAGDKPSGELAATLIRGLQSRFWDAEAGRFYATPKSDTAEWWARVYSPAPAAGDPPTAEPAMLMTLTEKPADDAARAMADLLTRVLVEDGKASADPIRGDVLLALDLARR